MTINTDNLSGFEYLVLRAKRAAYGDSNDREISLLQDAVSEACLRLDVDEQALAEAADEWATEKGL